MADNDVVDNGANADYTARDKDRGGVKTQIVGLDLNVGGGAESLMRQIPTHAACYRLASGRELTSTPAANGEKQIATIYHAASSTKTVRLQKVSVVVSSMGTALHQVELRRLSGATAPATGNPAITPGVFELPDAAAEATCLALPTTAGSEPSPSPPLSPNFALNAGAPVAVGNPSGLAAEELVLYVAGGWSRKPLTMRAGVAEGFVIIHRATAAAAFNFTAFIEFTEE